ncbi:MAG: LysR family transcriptional regulator [Myxococcota bacterium]
MLDWDDLRHVLAVHREGSLTLAARTLGVTRTTVGRRIRSAEAQLGVRLFDRTPEGLVATSAGDDLAETAIEVEEAILASEGRVLGQDVALHGPLRVSTLDFVYEGYAEIFASFVERFPRIELQVTTTDVYVSLLRREADVALRLGNAPAEHLVGRRVTRIPFDVYAARSLVTSLGEDAELSDYPWLQWTDPDQAGWLDAWLADHAPGARAVMRVGSFDVLYRSVRSGIGVHFLPCVLGDVHDDLVCLDAPLQDETRDLWLLTQPDLRRNRRVRAFMDHVYDTLASPRASVHHP